MIPPSFVNKTKDVVRDMVFGMQDGLISNLGLVLGVFQGGGGKFAIVIAGLASMFAGAFSMSAGSYLSAKSQREVYEQEIAETKKKLEENPQKHLLEMKKILKKEKFDEDEIVALLHHFEKHNQISFSINYVQKKLGLFEGKLELPFKNALAMFFSFLIGSAFPILPFILFTNSHAAIISVSLTISVLFIIGFAKTYYTKLNWLKSGLEIVLVGLGAAVIGYLVGLVLSLVN